LTVVFLQAGRLEVARTALRARFARFARLNELKTRDQRRRAAMLARSPSRYWALARMKRERARKHAEKRLKAAFSVQSNTYTQIPGKGRFTPTYLWTPPY